MAEQYIGIYVDDSNYFEMLADWPVSYSVTSSGFSVEQDMGKGLVIERSWPYSGTDTLLGYSTTQGATSPDSGYAVGDTGTITTAGVYYFFSVASSGGVAT